MVDIRYFYPTVSNRWKKAEYCSLYLVNNKYSNFQKLCQVKFFSIFTCREFLLTTESLVSLWLGTNGCNSVLSRLHCNFFSISCLTEVNGALKRHEVSDVRMKRGMRIEKLFLEIVAKCRKGNCTKLS